MRKQSTANPFEQIRYWRISLLISSEHVGDYKLCNSEMILRKSSILSNNDLDHSLVKVCIFTVPDRSKLSVAFFNNSLRRRPLKNYCLIESQI